MSGRDIVHGGRSGAQPVAEPITGTTRTVSPNMADPPICC